jgi:hypothetical protein
VAVGQPPNFFDTLWKLAARLAIDIRACGLRRRNAC